MGFFSRAQKTKSEPERIPALFMRALAAMDNEAVDCSVYCQDTLATVPPFERVQVELRKPTSRVIPEGYTVEAGSLAVLLNGTFVGYLPPYKVEKRGLKPARATYGYVVPPYIDTAGATNGSYRLCLMFW